jgi:hypothetical protein
MIRYNSAMFLISKPTGEILWANNSFCEWIKYSVSELSKLTWHQISVRDEDLEADIVAAGQLSEYNLSYVIQKRYIPKNDKPILGNLYVTRYPARGSIEFCFCRWEPLVNGTAQAFEFALESQRKIAAQMQQLTTRVESLSQQTTEENFFLSAFRMASKYPKISLACVMVILSVGGCDAALNTLERMGYVKSKAVVVEHTK